MFCGLISLCLPISVLTLLNYAVNIFLLKYLSQSSLTVSYLKQFCLLTDIPTIYKNVSTKYKKYQVFGLSSGMFSLPGNFYMSAREG